VFTIRTKLCVYVILVLLVLQKHLERELCLPMLLKILADTMSYFSSVCYCLLRAIREKKECFKRLHLDKSATNIEGYRLAKRSAKRAVSVAKGQAFDNLYQRLGTKEGEKDIYRIARARERKTRDINQIKCIKDGTDRLLVKDEEIKDRWREYFDNLFNGENEGPTFELDDSFDDTNRRFVRRIQEAEIGEALKRMK
jgi:hypothetical protein